MLLNYRLRYTFQEIIINTYEVSLGSELTHLIQTYNPRWLRAFPKQALAHAYST